MHSRAPAGLASLVALASCALATGCGSGPGRGDDVLVRDSAGIRIVENRAPTWAEHDAWRLSMQPELRIGVLEGDPAYQFGRIGSVRLMTDGRIAVADAGAQELRFFEATGRHVGTVGGDGSGPGEYRLLSELILLPGDTILVPDFNQSRVSWLAPDGSFLRSVPHLNPIVTGVLSDGGLVRTVSLSGQWATGPVEYRAAVVRFEPGTADSDTLFVFPGGQHLHHERLLDGNVQRYGTPLPFGRTGGHLAVANDVLYTGDGATYEIRAADPGGHVHMIIRRDVRVERVSAEHLAAYREQALSFVADPEARRQRERELLNQPHAAEIPAFQAMRTDREGRLWVQRYAMPTDTTRTWDVFSADGRWLGPVVFPAPLRITDIAGGRLAGGFQDDLGVPYVHVYRLEHWREADPL